MITVENANKNGFQFKVTSRSGNTLLESIAFTDKREAEQTVQQLSRAQVTFQKVERKTNLEGKFLFHLKNEEGKILGTSGLYSSEAGMENGIKNFRKNLTSA